VALRATAQACSRQACPLPGWLRATLLHPPPSHPPALPPTPAAAARAAPPQVRTQFRKIFTQMGFEEMPTNNYVESSFWNFDALFQPQQHPARDAHDTFFLTSELGALAAGGPRCWVTLGLPVAPGWLASLPCAAQLGVSRPARC
jgi:hypothetical protein